MNHRDSRVPPAWPIREWASRQATRAGRPSRLHQDDMTARPPDLLSNGAGRYYLQCDRCRRSSPTWPAPDGLRLLAAAQAADWTVGPDYRVLCPTCRRRGERIGGVRA